MRPLLLISIVLLSAAAPARGQEAGATEAAIIAGSLFRAINVPFTSGGATLLPSARPALDAVAEVLHRHPSLRLEISGHTDAVGSAPANLRLSDDRALAVKAYLMARHGIDPRRLETVGYGASMPVASNDSPAGRALNRRVEFRILDRAVPADPVETEPAEADPVADADALREQMQREVEQAVREALGGAEPDAAAARLAELERELEDLLARIERSETPGPIAPPAGPPVRRGRFALLPFTGFYLRGDFPILLGLRADVATALAGSPRLQPEAAFAFRPSGRAVVIGGNLVYPVGLGAANPVTPFVGVGIGFQNLDAVESVLNLLVGADYRFGFGVVFAELMVQDLGDYTRLIVGFRQEF